MAEAQRAFSIAQLRDAASEGFEALQDLLFEAGHRFTDKELSELEGAVYASDGSVNPDFDFRKLWEETSQKNGQTEQAEKPQKFMELLFAGEYKAAFASLFTVFDRIEKVVSGLGKGLGFNLSGLLGTVRNTLSSIASQFMPETKSSTTLAAKGDDASQSVDQVTAAQDKGNQATGNDVLTTPIQAASVSTAFNADGTENNQVPEKSAKAANPQPTKELGMG